MKLESYNAGYAQPSFKAGLNKSVQKPVEIIARRLIRTNRFSELQEVVDLLKDIKAVRTDLSLDMVKNPASIGLYKIKIEQIKDNGKEVHLTDLKSVLLGLKKVLQEMEMFKFEKLVDNMCTMTTVRKKAPLKPDEIARIANNELGGLF